jgi:hypothetical protein
VRNLTPVAADGVADVPVPRAVPATPAPDADVFATLLLGLIGGGAAMAAWTAATRRRGHRGRRHLTQSTASRKGPAPRALLVSRGRGPARW